MSMRERFLTDAATAVGHDPDYFFQEDNLGVEPTVGLGAFIPSAPDRACGESVVRDLTPARVAPLERPQCPFCFRYDGAHNSRCDAATAESKAAPAAPVASHANRHRTLGRRGERAMTDVRRKGRELAIEGAFEKSEQMFPMAGDVPEVVREDRLFRAMYHVSKKQGPKPDPALLQRMRERWVALTTGVELVKGDLS